MLAAFATTLAGALLQDAHAATNLLATLPGEWRDDLNRPLRLEALRGQRLIFTMAFAGCHRICPQTISHLQQLQQQLDERGSTATFVIVGYDPQGDDPPAWHQFRVARHLPRPNWLFLSGASEAQVHAFADRLGFQYWKYDEHVLHEERVVVLDPEGQLQVSFGPGRQLEIATIAPGALKGS